MKSGSLLAEAKGLAEITGISLDFLIIAALFVALSAYALYFGKNRIVSLILALYGAITLYTAFPYQNSVLIFRNSPGQVVVSKLVVFIVFTAILHLLFNRIVSIEYGFGRFRKPTEVALLSLSALVLMLVVVYQIIPIENFYNFSSIADGIFMAKQSLFWWLLAPIAVLFFAS